MFIILFFFAIYFSTFCLSVTEVTRQIVAVGGGIPDQAISSLEGNNVVEELIEDALEYIEKEREESNNRNYNIGDDALKYVKGEENSLQDEDALECNEKGEESNLENDNSLEKKVNCLLYTSDAADD